MRAVFSADLAADLAAVLAALLVAIFSTVFPTSSTQPDPDGQQIRPFNLAALRPARGIALAGGVLIVLFLTILSASLLPARLFDAAWQLRADGVLINASPFPLIDLVRLHVAPSLDLRNALLVRRRGYAVPPSN